MRGILALAAWPLVEIGLFVVIGGQIGVWATLAWVVLSAVLGVLILRREGRRGAVRFRGGMAMLREPGAIGAGLMRGLAAVLLILPGFLTDALGLLLLLPPVQAVLIAALMRRVQVRQAGARGAEVVEGDWEEVPPGESGRIGAPHRRPSGWTQE
jgi:UPF0716 protein FxsA